MAIELQKTWRGFAPGHVFDGELTAGVENLLVERLRVADYVTTETNKSEPQQAGNSKRNKRNKRKPRDTKAAE